MSRFAISDIHGCAKTFEALLEQIALTKDDTLFCWAISLTADRAVRK